jgi:hypothetical protein
MIPIVIAFCKRCLVSERPGYRQLDNITWRNTYQVFPVEFDEESIVVGPHSFHSRHSFTFHSADVNAGKASLRLNVPHGTQNLTRWKLSIVVTTYFIS